MLDRSDTFLYTLRFLFVGVLLTANFFLLSFLLSSLESNSAQTGGEEASPRASTVNASENPNVVAGGMTTMLYELGQSLGSIEHTMSSSINSAASAIAQSGKTVANGVQTGLAAVARTAGRGVVSVANVASGGILFIGNIPGNILSSVTDTSIVSAIIRPADNMEVPIIDPDSPELRKALAALPPTQDADALTPTNQGGPGPTWPIHGRITTHFGVAHWPYQATHSGIDISDGRAPGVTPVKPFRPGRVIDTVSSGSGLGNHVVVDHGNGVTSVYAHLASIAVQKGQEAGLHTTLGFEGSTGASTGSHLHFEIRVHGQAADPRQFIGGQP